MHAVRSPACVSARLPALPWQVVGPEEIEDGEALFQWMISPVDVETFYDAVHEVGGLWRGNLR